ncbi:MAG TPA: coniferyl aldehyde dehydrogenase [Casimicrobiaceae bacterium]|nr:coniferyl aldehyde dehydrogenase [Casimicrobiaceae bacterium]
MLPETAAAETTSTTPGQRTPPDAMRAAFDRMRAASRRDGYPPHAVRMDRLARLAKMTRRHAQDIIDAISADFGSRSAHETLIADLLAVDEAIRHAKRHLRGWMSAKRVPTGIKYRPGYNRLIPQPLGVVGIVAPWNYPYQLAMLPAVAALAAGNRVMIKPSEVTPHTAELMARIVGETFDANEVAVFPGDAATGGAFVELPFDHLFFTGSAGVGRMVAQAAAKNLTPVTLELGGKSPLIVDADADFAKIMPMVAIGKLFNAGQTCIAPDYALVPHARVDEFAEEMQRAVAKLYPTLAGNRDYSSIVNDRHYARLSALVEDARATGARVVAINPARESLDPAARKIAPTLLLGASEQAAVMHEEIFGPLFPVVGYDGIDAAIRYVNERPRPLALYWFGDGEANRDRVLRGTLAGGVTINGCLTHFAQEAQPFGGVGESGYGAYHGEYGFRTFSKEKPVYYQSRVGLMPMLLPPYGRRLDAVLAWFKQGGR